MTWSDANDYCLGFGRNLISIHSNETQWAMEELCDSVDHSGSQGCWMGLVCLNSVFCPNLYYPRSFYLFQYDSGSHEYVWSDGSESDYAFNATGHTSDRYPWNEDEPNSVNEDCIHLRRAVNYEWNDMSCTGFNYPICKGIPSSAPTSDPTAIPTADPTVDTSRDALVSWHCDDSSKLFVSRDNGETWTRQAMFSAPIQQQPIQSNVIGNISIHDTMHYEMDITVHSFPTGWASVCNYVTMSCGICF